ncbi:MAG: T9SS type A sorting domain-containing protein, partial [Ginsengibacter sp.]
WEYVVDTVFTVLAADSGKHFRVKVATTPANLLEDKCAVENSQKVFLQVFSMNCKALEEKFLNFSGKVISGHAELAWMTNNQRDSGEYEIERSDDGINFKKIGLIRISGSLNSTGYGFIDPDRMNSVAFYRLKVISQERNSQTYSKTVHLLNSNDFFRVSTPNPFKGNLKLEIFLPTDGEIDIQILNVLGKLMIKKVLTLSKGNSQYILPESGNLPQGWYILRTIHNGKPIQSRVFKSN